MYNIFQFLFGYPRPESPTLKNILIIIVQLEP